MKRYAFVNILEYWNLECYVMGSLLIQIILVLIAPMRRWSNNGLMHVVIWLVYLMANFFSTFALSLIYYHVAAKDEKEYAVYPLWAPFLLVHLGGPHTITALSVEDNNLWHRHVLALMVQGCSVLVVLYQYRILDSEWLVPTAIVFLVGIVKCFERIFSLQFASSDFVRGSILRRAAAGDVGNKTTSPPSEDEELEIVRRGYKLYQTFKGFIIDHTFIINNSKDDDECGTDMKWFRSLDVKKAFKVMEMELYFMYEAMFTKMIAVEYWKNNYFWCIWRFVCHALLITVTVIFFCHSKHQLHPSVIGITYCLLGCALLLDQIALLNLIFSHWTIVKIMNSHWYKATASRKGTKVVVRKTILPVINCGLKLFVSKPWSSKIIQYSLVRHSLRGRWKWAELKPEFYSLREVMDSCLHTKTAQVDHRLKELVFEYIKRKANSQQEYVRNHHQQQQQCPHYVDMDDYATCVLILHVATEMCYYFTAGGREANEKEDAKLCKQISQYLAYLLVLEGNITSTLPGSIGMRFKDICSEQVHHTFDHLYSAFNEPDKGRWCRKRMSRQQACQGLINKELEKRRNNKSTDVEQPRASEDPCLTKDSSCNDEQSEDNNNPKGFNYLARAMSSQMRKCADPCLCMEFSPRNESDNHEKSVLPKVVNLAVAMINQIDPEAGNNKQQQIDPEAGNNKQQQIDPEAGNNKQQQIDPKAGNNKQQQQQRRKVFWKGLTEVWVVLLVYASSHCRGDVYYLNRGGQFYTFVRLLMAHFGLQQSLKFERSFQFHNEICTNLSEPSFQLYNEICTNLETDQTHSLSGK